MSRPVIAIYFILVACGIGLAVFSGKPVGPQSGQGAGTPETPPDSTQVMADIPRLPPVRKPDSSLLSEANTERLMLDSGEHVERWKSGTHEAGVLASTLGARSGKQALQFHVQVDHLTSDRSDGQYLKGWPRIRTSWKKWKEVPPQAWSEYEALEFWVYGVSSDAAATELTLGYIMRWPAGAGVAKSRDSTVSCLVAQWTRVRMDLCRVKNAQAPSYLQFFVSESNYAHGEILDFVIDDIALVRHSRPVFVAARLRRRAIYASLGSISAHYILSAKSLDNTSILAELVTTRGDKPLGKFPAERRGVLRLAVDNPAPGPYRLRLTVIEPGSRAGDVRELEMRVVEKPW